MRISGYDLLSPIGIGPDGASYLAEQRVGKQVRPLEVRLLAEAKADASRWKLLSRRLRVVALLQHPGAVSLLKFEPDLDPPLAVMERSLPSSMPERLSVLTISEIIALGRQLARVLSAAHRIGLAHGNVRPHTILGDVSAVKLDFSGLEVNNVPPGDPAFMAPELVVVDSTSRLSRANAHTDLYSLGAVLFRLLTEQASPGPDSELIDDPSIPRPLRRMVSELLAQDPEQRPSARDIAQRLTALEGPQQATILDADSSEQGGPKEDVEGKGPPSQVGRFRLVEKLGQGGMGAVYRAEDLTDGSIVAVKLLRSDWGADPQHLRRFHKEARLLAEVQHPNVVNLIEVNEDDGLHYLAMEYINGPDLDEWIQTHGRLTEAQALSLIADIARGLAQAHEAGIVHRDIKPANILLNARHDLVGVSNTSIMPTPKLTDFGLARHVAQSESLNVTHAGAIIGTPMYMSPEQCAGEYIDARSDVYSLGCTMYHLLAGRPPFDAESILGLIAKHRTEPVPPLGKINPDVSEAVCRVVEKSLAKRPEGRYPDAGAMLLDLERLLRGEPSTIAVHPRLPICEASRVLEYDFDWQLDSSPEQLWPHVSNTERLNRALGLSAVQFSMREDEDEKGKRVRRFGNFRKTGMTFDWEEHPFEWIEARRMGVLREYSSGPFRWLTSVVELQPRADGGTNLTHRLKMEPRGILGRTLAAVEVGIRTRRSLEQIYKRIDRVVSGQAASPDGAHALIDPFEDAHELSRGRRKKLESLLDPLLGLGLDPRVVEHFGEFLASAPPQEVARIRPLALARRLRVDSEALTAVCLHGARNGLLVMLWDILCPVCRIPTQVMETLKALKEHGRCEACRLDYELDFAGSVEMIFRPHPEVRDCETATFCVGGPAHSPHVVVQARVGAGERMELDLNLSEGSYRIRGPQLRAALDFRVEPEGRVVRWDVHVSGPMDGVRPSILKAGGQVLVLSNEGDQELVVRVERVAPRADALTAARASSLALFRELFPQEALSPGRLISVTTLTFLVFDLARGEELYLRLGDARAFEVLHAYMALATEAVVREGGAVVKTLGEGLLAVFSEPAAAVRVALSMPAALAANETTRDLHVRAGVHRGPALAATINDHLDYFGATMHQVLRLTAVTGADELMLTQAAASDPGIAALLDAKRLPSQLIPGPMGGLLRRFGLTAK